MSTDLQNPKEREQLHKCSKIFFLNILTQGLVFFFFFVAAWLSFEIIPGLFVRDAVSLPPSPGKCIQVGEAATRLITWHAVNAGKKKDQRLKTYHVLKALKERLTLLPKVLDFWCHFTCQMAQSQ